MQVPDVQRTQGTEQTRLLIPDAVRFERHRTFHGDQREHFQHVVLEHVPQQSGPVEISGAVFDADRFRHRDLHRIDVIAVPDRFENEVGKPEHQDILHRFLA